MPAKPIEFEEIDAHVATLDVAALRVVVKAASKAGIPANTLAAGPAAIPNPFQALERLCVLYTAVRPILVGLAAVPLIPRRWRDVLELFRQGLDGLCPRGGA